MKKVIMQKLWNINSIRLLLPIVMVMAIGTGFIGIRAMADDNINASSVSSNCEVTCVEVKDSGFFPSELAVKTGEFVQFNSSDSNIHNLALGNGVEQNPEDTLTESTDDHHGDQDPGHTHDGTHDHQSGTESGEFGIGEAWRVQFKVPGTYIIHDHLYPDNSILVVVYDPSESME